MDSPSSETTQLEFQDTGALDGVDDPLRADISCIAVSGDCVFVACDETASIEVLTRQEDGSYGAHRHIALGNFFKLPDGPHGEMDIEGLSVDGGYLWITGSHSLKRDKPERDENGAVDALSRMTDIDRDPNRYFIGCAPIGRDTEGACLVKTGEGRRAACVKQKKNKSKLLKWLKDDPHLSAFLDLPSKENGFDIEGLAVKGERVWLGLRGPVLRGHGVILELSMKRPKPSRLKARKIEDGRRYRKYVLDTAGLGVRDLCFDGEDLLVLVGTPLASDGPARVLRWKNAAQDNTSSVVDPSRLSVECELPYRGAVDHPEGIDLLPAGDGAGKRLIVVYDSPSEERLSAAPGRLVADIIPLEDR